MDELRYHETRFRFDARREILWKTLCNSYFQEPGSIKLSRSRTRRRLWAFHQQYSVRASPFKERRIIIGIHAGGLGDHLAYSALPRLYKRAGAKQVLLSTRTNHGEPFTRNSEVSQIVWGPNPFVDGFTDEPANVGEKGWPPIEYFKAAKTTISPIDTVCKVHGLPVLKADGVTRVLSPIPDFFYSPKGRADFSDKVVCDPRSISQGFNPEVFAQFVQFIAKWHDLILDEIVVLDSKFAGGHGKSTLPRNIRYHVQNIFEYADIVKSAKCFLVTESGGQSLAAAIRSSGTFVLTSSRAFNESHFLWPSNYYCVTSQMTSKTEEWP
jgi:hypothetical protein